MKWRRFLSRRREVEEWNKEEEKRRRFYRTLDIPIAVTRQTRSAANTSSSSSITESCILYNLLCKTSAQFLPPLSCSCSCPPLFCSSSLSLTSFLPFLPLFLLSPFFPSSSPAGCRMGLAEKEDQRWRCRRWGSDR